MPNLRARMAGIVKKVTRWWGNTPIVATITGLRHYLRIPVVEFPVLRQAENRLWQRMNELEEASGSILDLFFLPRGGEGDIENGDEEQDTLASLGILLYEYLLPAMKIVAIVVVVVFLFKIFWG